MPMEPKMYIPPDAKEDVPTPRPDPRKPPVKIGASNEEVAAAPKKKKPYTIGEHLLAIGRAGFEGDRSPRRLRGKGPGGLYDRTEDED